MTTKIAGKKTAGVDIPILDLKLAMFYLSSPFQDDVILIGGRAVNAYNFASSRPTNNVNVVVRFALTTDLFLNELPNQIKRSVDNDNGVYFRPSEVDIDQEVNLGKRVKLYYHSPRTVKMPDGRIEIDFYYPGYKLMANNGMPRFDINGIPIEDVIGRASKVIMDDEEIKIVNMPMLLLMKYDTYKDRGLDRDLEDVVSLFRNHYQEDATRFAKLRAELISLVRQYWKKSPEEHRSEAAVMAFFDRLALTQAVAGA